MHPVKYRFQNAFKISKHENCIIKGKKIILKSTVRRAISAHLYVNRIIIHLKYGPPVLHFTHK